MSIYIITGVVSLLAVLGLLFYWLKKRKKSNHSTKYGGDMAEYGVQVLTANGLENINLGEIVKSVISIGINWDSSRSASHTVVLPRKLSLQSKIVFITRTLAKIPAIAFATQDRYRKVYYKLSGETSITFSLNPISNQYVFLLERELTGIGLVGMVVSYE